MAKTNKSFCLQQVVKIVEGQGAVLLVLSALMWF